MSELDSGGQKPADQRLSSNKIAEITGSRVRSDDLDNSNAELIVQDEDLSASN